MPDLNNSESARIKKGVIYVFNACFLAGGFRFTVMFVPETVSCNIKRLLLM